MIQYMNLPVQLLFEEDQYERVALNSPKKQKKLKIHQRQGGNSVLQPNRTKMGADYPARAKTVYTHNHHNTRILEQAHC
jgi:hypothetical protein